MPKALPLNENPFEATPPPKQQLDTSLRTPQARLLNALMPKNPGDEPFDWPLLNRSALGVQAGYTAISGTVTRALNGVPEGSPNNPHPGLLERRLIEEVEIELDSGVEINYRITAIGVIVFKQWLADGNTIPPPRDKSLCTNDRYRKTQD